MKRNISEDLPARKFAPAASTGGGSEADGGDNLEKKARAALSDSKYRVRLDMGKDTHMDPAAVVRAVEAKLESSEYSKVVVARAIQILRGDGQKKEIKEFASQNVARALYSVFVEQPSKIIDEEYIEKLKEELSKEYQNPEQRKYTYRVTDKLTGNSYITKKTRSEANKLRVNPNISSVEMVDEREGDQRQESERTKGSQTASVAAGKGLAKIDYDGDGKVESGAKEYRGSVHNAIQRKRGGSPDGKDTSSVREEFIGEKDNGGKNPQITPMPPKKKNNYKVHGPSTKDDLTMHQELEGEMIAETGYSKFLKKVRSLQEMAVSKDKKELAGKESKCDDSSEDQTTIDPRSTKTTDNLRRNYLRAMGLKMSYEPEGEVIDEEMPKKVKGKKLSGTTTFTPRGGPYGRRANEKKDPKSMKPIFPGPRENQSPDDDEDNGEHPSLTASQRNRRPGYS
jgi:hypothetical protein